MDDEHAHDGSRIGLHGTIGALDTAARTFAVRGVTVGGAGTVELHDAAALANSRFVEVRGGLPRNGTAEDATRIELKPAA